MFLLCCRTSRHHKTDLDTSLRLETGKVNGRATWRIMQSKPKLALVKVSQETLAEMVGTTRSRVSYFMNRFRKMGFIDYNGTLRVHKALLTFLLDE
jgi:CRP-like cAMP-binding protein